MLGKCKNCIIFVEQFTHQSYDKIIQCKSHDKITIKSLKLFIHPKIYFMATRQAPYESPFRIKTRKQKEEIIASYNEMKKDPRNSTTEWKNQTAKKYGISIHTIDYYLRNRKKSNS